MGFIDLITFLALNDMIKENFDDFGKEVKKEAEKSKKSAVSQHIEEAVKRRGNDIVNNCKVLFRGATTVLLYNGKVYQSTAEDKDDYDREKGLMSCLLKACGISTTDIINLINKYEPKSFFNPDDININPKAAWVRKENRKK